VVYCRPLCSPGGLPSIHGAAEACRQWPHDGYRHERRPDRALPRQMLRPRGGVYQQPAEHRAGRTPEGARQAEAPAALEHVGHLPAWQHPLPQLLHSARLRLPPRGAHARPWSSAHPLPLTASHLDRHRPAAHGTMRRHVPVRQHAAAGALPSSDRADGLLRPSAHRCA
jgi:hypothetical protein